MFLPSWSVKVYLNILSKVRFKYLAAISERRKIIMEAGDKSVLVECFGEHPVVRIVDFLIENKLFDFSKKQIMEEVGISKATLFKYFPRLEEAGIVKASRKFGKTKLYRINMESPVVRKIIDLGLALADEASRKTVEKELRATPRKEDTGREIKNKRFKSFRKEL